MTLNNAAWAIDGATLNSALARVGAYAGIGGSEGIVAKGDLAVTELDTPGNGVQISSGSGLILNRYQGTHIDQAYVVTNPAAHVLSAGDMPSTNPSIAYYILAIVVGDPESSFSQTGHPWMLGTDPPSGEEDTFLYVRPTLIPCGSTDTDLGSIGYPAIPLARIAVPANLGSITNANITDLRNLAQPKSQLVQSLAGAPSGTVSLTTSYQRCPDVNAIVCQIPPWAVKAKISGFVEGMKLQTNGAGSFRAYMTTGDGRATGELTNIEETVPAHANERRSYNVGGEIDVRDYAGETHAFGVQAKCQSGDAGFITCDGSSSVFLSVYFEEQPIS